MKQAHQEKSITGKYYRQSALAEFNRFYKNVRPNTRMHGIKLHHDNAPAQEYKLVQEYLADENIESLPLPPDFPVWDRLPTFLSR